MAVLSGVIRATLVVLMLSLPIAPAQAQGAVPMQLYEQKVKAGLIYNFLKYTSWPEDRFDNHNLEVCLYGGDPLDGYLYPLDGRTAHQYRINIRNVQTLSSAASCHLVFIHKDEAYALPELLPYLHDRNVMTISDIEGFAARGGMVELSKQPDRRIHLFINKKAIDNSGLKLESSVLKLATLID